MNIDASASTTSDTNVRVRVCAPDQLATVRRYFSALVAEPAGTTLVAWLGPEPVGHIQVRWRGSVHRHVRARLHRTPEIRRLRVHETSQRQGIGAALLEAAEVLVSQHGFRSVGLAVGVSNGSAIALYERSGYRRAAIAPFVSAMGLNEQGQRFDHTVQYMVKPIQMPKPISGIGRSTQADTVDLRNQPLVVA